MLRGAARPTGLGRCRLEEHCGYAVDSPSHGYLGPSAISLPRRGNLAPPV